MSLLYKLYASKFIFRMLSSWLTFFPLSYPQLALQLARKNLVKNMIGKSLRGGKKERGGVGRVVQWVRGGFSGAAKAITKGDDNAKWSPHEREKKKKSMVVTPRIIVQLSVTPPLLLRSSSLEHRGWGRRRKNKGVSSRESEKKGEKSEH